MRKNSHMSEELKEKNRQSNLLIRDKLSAQKMGAKNPMFNKPVSVETRKKKSLSMLGKNTGPMSEQHKTNLSLSATIVLNQPETVRKKSSAAKTAWSDPIKRENIYTAIVTSRKRPEVKKIYKEAYNRPEVRQKHRLAMIDYLENTGGCTPCVGRKANKYFTQFMEDHPKITDAITYVTTGYEYKTKSGHFLDWISFKVKLIIEYDEKHHYKNGVLSEHDVEKERCVRLEFPGFEFKRVKEEN